jgi:hypothetical protein
MIENSPASIPLEAQTLLGGGLGDELLGGRVEFRGRTSVELRREAWRRTGRTRRFAHALGGHARCSAESRRELVAGADDRVSS